VAACCLNPKPEIRNPKEIRNPRTEVVFAVKNSRRTQQGPKTGALFIHAMTLFRFYLIIYVYSLLCWMALHI